MSLVELFFDDTKTKSQKDLIAIASYGHDLSELQDQLFKEVKEALIFDGYLSYFLKRYSFSDSSCLFGNKQTNSIICNLTSYYADFESIQKLARVPGISLGEVYMNDIVVGNIGPIEMTIEVYPYEQDKNFLQRVIDRVNQIQSGSF